jgi:fatty acid amide hydrolase 2
LADRKGVINPFWELAKFFFGKSNHSFPAIIVGIAEKVAYSQADSKYQRKMIEGCDHLREEFQHLLGDDGVFLYPSYPHAALFHNQAMLMPFGFAYQSIFNVLKFPVTQCPVGLSRDGLPLGVQVVSRLHNDHLTLSVAEALEETLCQWVPPCDVEISET